MIKQTITGIKHGYQAAKSFVLGKGCVADKLADSLVKSAPKTTRKNSAGSGMIETIKGTATPPTPLSDKSQIEMQNRLSRFLIDYELPEGLKKVKK